MRTGGGSIPEVGETPQGYNCTFTVTVASKHMFAQMFKNLPKADFDKDKESGKWMIRPPF